MPTTYALRIIAPNTFQIAKFTDDFIVDATYTLTRKGIGFTCDCPANYKNKMKPCKHQRMMPFLMGAVNLPRFFDPDTGNWHGLMSLAPGMQMEHAEGEAATFGKGPAIAAAAEMKAENEQHPLVQKGVEQQDEEPDTAPTPAVSGQVGVSPQTERPMAPAPSAPNSNVVTRRI